MPITEVEISNFILYFEKLTIGFLGYFSSCFGIANLGNFHELKFQNGGIPITEVKISNFILYFDELTIGFLRCFSSCFGIVNIGNFDELKFGNDGIPITELEISYFISYFEKFPWILVKILEIIVRDKRVLILDNKVQNFVLFGISSSSKIRSFH